MSDLTVLTGQWALGVLAVAAWLLWFAGRALWRCWQRAEVVRATSHERLKFIGQDDG